MSCDPVLAPSPNSYGNCYPADQFLDVPQNFVHPDEQTGNPNLGSDLDQLKAAFWDKFGGGSNGLEHVPGGVIPAGAVPATHLVVIEADVCASVPQSVCADADEAVTASNEPTSINAVMTASSRFMVVSPIGSTGVLEQRATIAHIRAVYPKCLLARGLNRCPHARYPCCTQDEEKVWQ